MASKKPKKDRSDITVGSLEKKHGLPPGTVRNPDGRDTRSDKQLKTIRKESEKRGGRKGKK
jgi:hypothetical protein